MRIERHRKQQYCKCPANSERSRPSESLEIRQKPAPEHFRIWWVCQGKVCSLLGQFRQHIRPLGDYCDGGTGAVLGKTFGHGSFDALYWFYE